MYQCELVWNREFSFVPYGKEHETIDEAKAYGITLKSMGDGARVKKVQVIDLDTGDIVLKSHEIN